MPILEALRAKKGDALLLHYGTKQDPRLVVIDGGPGGVYEESLRPRLEQLRAAGKKERLHIRLMMVSHVDDDHINGLIKLTDLLTTQQESQQTLDYKIDVLWHNSFDDVFDTVAEDLLDTPAAGEPTAAAIETLSSDLQLCEHSALMLASTGQGQTLRNNAVGLALTVNSPFDGLVTTSDKPNKIGGVDYTVLGPSKKRLLEFQQKWNKDLRKKAKSKDKKDKVEVAEYLDQSAFNLASIVVLAEVEGKKLLLTGDARGDDVLEGAKEVGLLTEGGTCPVDLLKAPHHGSDRNVEADFFAAFPARHYLMSGDGQHGNPEPTTFELLLEGRQTDNEPFTIYLTYDPHDFKPHTVKRGQPKVPYDVARLCKILQPHLDSGRVTLVTPQPGDLSVNVTL
jgi:beta-lactamase superfamily II metal-dependent hydrolase